MTYRVHSHLDFYAPSGAHLNLYIHDWSKYRTIFSTQIEDEQFHFFL